MTKVAILPESIEGGALRYRAIAGDEQSVGATAGEALDAITSQLQAYGTGMLIVVQSFQPDEYFTAAQRARLESLMVRWRTARDTGVPLPTADQIELDTLVASEQEAAGKRAVSLARELIN